MRRDIRLKELPPSERVYRKPLEHQVKDSDGTLGDRDYLMESDANGFIRSAMPQDEMSEQVIVLGDSVIECMFVDHGQRLTDHAEKALNSLGMSVAVRNGGVTGANSLHILNLIINKIVPLKPKLLVIGGGVMDQDCMQHPDSYWNQHPYLATIRTEPTPEGYEKENLPSLQFTDRLHILRLIKTVCSEFGIPLAFATFPHRGIDAYAIERMSWFKDYQDRRRQVNAQTREFALTENLPLIDMEREFSGAVSIFYDQFHLNSKGTEVAGLYLAGEIMRVLSMKDASPVASGFVDRIKRRLSR